MLLLLLLVRALSINVIAAALGIIRDALETAVCAAPVVRLGKTLIRVSCGCVVGVVDKRRFLVISL